MVELARKLAPAEYLEGEKVAGVRHQYVDGEAYAMAGGTKTHNEVAGNFYGLLRAHSRGTPCRGFIGDVKVHVA